MPIVPAGSTNLSSIGVPNVYVQITPPNPLLNGVPSDVIGVVGTATWGAKNSITVIGTLQQLVSQYGNPQISNYDMGTQIFEAMRQGANNFLCVRVTDGTDSAASTDILDTDEAIGAILSSKYTGTLGNTTNAILGHGSNYTDSVPVYKLTIYMDGGIPEVFDNIGGTGADFWSALVDAVNMGQNNVRGPSQLCVAETNNIVSSVTVVTAGSYATMPSFAASGSGSGATFTGVMKAVSASASTAGTGYAPTNTITLTGGTHSANAILTVATTKLVSAAINAAGADYAVNDTIVLAGGTFGTAAVVTVDTVNGSGAILTFTISTAGSYTANSTTFTQGSTSGIGTGATFNTGVFGVNTVTVTTAGSYTALAANPVAQGSTSGSGTGAQFTVLWGVLAVGVATPGSGYTVSSTLSITGGGGSGGGSGTLVLGSAIAPEQDSYVLAGGTNGNDNVTDSTLIGLDTGSRTGMYVLRGTDASIVMLCGQTDATKWDDEASFGEQEGMYMIGVMSPVYYNDISSAVSAKRAASVLSYDFKLLNGDWAYLDDPFNGVTRLVSPQGYAAGVMATQLPSGSSLNKQIRGIVGTQKTAEKQMYSDADLLQLMNAGIDVITRPIPASKEAFGVRLGINTSGNVLTKFDNYPRMVNFLSRTIVAGMGDFIGLPQTIDVRRQARARIEGFLSNLEQLGMIGNVNGGAAFSVVLNETNNPTDRVSQGFMQVDVQVTIFSIIQQLVINLQAGGNVQISISPPQLLAA